jgi:hypothetical protein
VPLELVSFACQAVVETAVGLMQAAPFGWVRNRSKQEPSARNGSDMSDVAFETAQVFWEPNIAFPISYLRLTK